MKFQASNNLKLLQISSAYLILTSIGPFVSNPNLTTLDRNSRWYRLSTSRFQKPDTVPFAVSTTRLAATIFRCIYARGTIYPGFSHPRSYPHSSGNDKRKALAMRSPTIEPFIAAAIRSGTGTRLQMYRYGHA